jgi:hypothetical protein
LASPVGAVGLAILVYTVEALFFRRMTADDTASARGGLGQPAE